MTEHARIGDLFLGYEGLAILRAWALDPTAVKARADEISEIVDQLNELPFAADAIGTEVTSLDGYREWAPIYDNPAANPMILAEQAAVWRLLEAYPPGRALDAACGTGRHAGFLAERGHQVIGVDASAAMLDVARTKVGNAQFVTGDLTALPLAGASIDFAVCALALTHLADPLPAIRELARVVRPGGRVVMSDVHPFMVALAFQAFFHRRSGEMGFIRNYMHLTSTYLSAFQQAGLQVRSCLEPCWTEAELAAERWATVAPDLPRAAYAGLPIVLIWDTERA